MEHKGPYSTMSQPSSDKSRDPYHASYADHQDMMLSEDEEESATLAEPMTLEGAKQLAQTSVVVPATTPTPPPTSLASISPPPPHPLVAPLTSPHHSTHHHPHHHHLTSPPPPHHHHHHLTSPPPPPHHHLTSPPPHHHPHLTPPLPHHHHHHHIWGATHEEEEEEEEPQDLPSTVDIQAIRDSPSPDHSKGQLVTINENWDSVEDQEQGEEESEAYESDTDGSESDSDSRLSSRSRSASRDSIKSRSASRSLSPSNSKSDSGSQDSESDSSDWSDSSSSASDDERKKEYEDGDSSPMNKPLPRRKPQLTAAKLTLSDGYRRGPRGDGSGTYNPGGAGGGRVASPSLKNSSSVPHMLDKHKPPSQSFTSPSVDSIMNVGFGVGKTTKPPPPATAAAAVIVKSSGKSSIFSDDDTSEGSDVEKGEVVNNKCVQLSKVEEVKQILPVPLSKGPLTPPAKSEVPESSLHPCTKEGSARDSSSVNKSAADLGAGDDHRPDDRGSEEGGGKVKTASVEAKPCVTPPNLKVEDGKGISFQPYRQSSPSPTERKCEVVPKWDEDKGEESRGSNVSVAELEERRREKELELNREFDRLLFSTKTLKPGEQPRTLLLAGESRKAGDASPSDTARPGKVYESPKANRVYPSASPQASGRQSNKACPSGKTDLPSSAAGQCTKMLQAETVLQDVKDINTHDKNKTKQETPTWPEKQKDVQSDDLCKDSLEEAGCKNEPQRGLTGDGALDRTASKEVVTEQKFCRDSLFENLPSREVMNGRNVSSDCCVEKRGSKDLEVERNLAMEHQPSRAHVKESSVEKCPRNDVLSDTLTKTVSEKKSKEMTSEKKAIEEVHDKKNSTGMGGEWRSSGDMEYQPATLKETSGISKLENNHSKDHLEKKSKRDLNSSHRSARNDIFDKPKQSRSSYISKRSTRDSSTDRKSNRDSSLEKKIKESPEDTFGGADVHESRLEDTPKASKQNSEAVDDKKPYRDMPYINCSAKVKSSEKKPVRNSSPDKKSGKGAGPEKRAGRETGSECKAEVFSDHHKDSAQGRKSSKETCPEKKPNKNVPPDKKTHESANSNKKQSKTDSTDKKQKSEERLNRKHSKEPHGERKSHRDNSSERPNSKDASHKTISSEGCRESKPEREVDIEGGQDHHLPRPNKDHSTKKSKEHKEHTTDKHHTSPEKPSSKDSSMEKRIKKDLSNSEKHRREDSSDRNQTKDTSSQNRYSNEAECERLPSIVSSGDKKPLREPGRVKDLDFIKRIARDHSLDTSYTVNNILHKMSSKKQSMKDGSSRKKVKAERSAEKHHEKSTSISERSPASENALRKDSGGDMSSPREVSTKNKMTGDKWDEFSDGSKFHKAKKLLTEKNGDAATPRPPKLSVSPAESPKFKHRNKLSHSGETALNTSTSSSSSSTYSPSPGKSSKEGGIRAENVSPTSGKDKPEHQEKGEALRSPGEKGVCIRPTIADIVKGRERRKSTETDRYNGGEKGKRGDMYRDETSTDSETSEELNEKVDLDTEQTQTFSVSESNFNQGRLTMKIAAMKMAKFGRTGLREVTGGRPPNQV
ncbi:protein split ends-like isoform X2 [Scylla paramamosain]|uniref:protein split ends-like isoform X2 n=1 Tax=Scylla paramamosain TaxID=85552 RepID=UPI0030830531